MTIGIKSLEFSENFDTVRKTWNNCSLKRHCPLKYRKIGAFPLLLLFGKSRCISANNFLGYYFSPIFQRIFTLAYMFKPLLYNVQTMSQYTLSNVHTLSKKTNHQIMWKIYFAILYECIWSNKNHKTDISTNVKSAFFYSVKKFYKIYPQLCLYCTCDITVFISQQIVNLVNIFTRQDKCLLIIHVVQ